MSSLFPYLSRKNLKKMFSRTGLVLQPADEKTSEADGFGSKLSICIEKVDPEILARYGAIATKCANAPAVFFCTPGGRIIWQNSEWPLELDSLREDIITHLGKSTACEVAVAQSRAPIDPSQKDKNKTNEARVCAVVPLHAGTGELIGGLCVADDLDRFFEPEEKKQLRALAIELVAKLELQETARQCLHSHHAIQKLHRFLAEQHGSAWLGQFLIHLAESAEAEYAFVLERSADRPSIARTVIVACRGGLIENFDYPLENSPLEHMKPGEVCCHGRDILKHFTDDRTLMQMGIEGFAAVCIDSPPARSSRWVVMMDRKTIAAPAVAEAVLSAVAIPLAARLDHDRMKQALEAEQEKHRGTVADALEGFYRMTEDGRYLSCNPAFASILGYSSPDELIASVNGASATLYADVDRRKRLLNHTKSKRQWFEEKSEVFHKTGGRIWIAEKIRCVRGSGEKSFLFEGCVQDVTPQVLAEESFRASETRFHALFEHAAAGFALADRQGLITKANPALERLLGLTEAELLHRSLRDLGADDDDAQERALQAEFAAGKRDHYRVEKLLTCNEKGSIWTRIWTSAVRDRDGALVSMILMVEDLTAQKESDELFQARSALFEAFFEHAAIGVLISDHEGRVDRANPAIARMLDRTEKQLRGKTLSEIVHADDREVCARQESECVGAKRDRFQIEVRSPGPQLHWCRLTVSAVRSPAREFQYWIAMFEDITARREAEEALARSDEPIRNLLDEAGLGVAIAEGDGNFNRSNKALQTMVGHSDKSLLAKSLSDLIHPDDRNLIAEPRRELLAGKRSHFQTEARFLRKDRADLWVRLTMAALRRNEGAGSCLIHLFEDISERKQADKALTESREQVRDVFETPGMALSFLDAKGAITQSNAALQKLLDFSPEELKSKSLADLTHPEDRERCQKLLSDFSDGDASHTRIDGRLLRKSGGHVWTRTILSRLHGHNGTAPGMIGVIENITPQKESEEALAESRLHYRKLFDEAAFGSALLDLQGRILETNTTMAELLSRTRDEMKGRSAADFVHADDRETFKAMLAECNDSKRERFQIEVRAVRGESEPLPVRLRATMVRRKDDRPESILLTLESLVALRAAEAEIRKAREQIAALEQKQSADAADHLKQIEALEQRQKAADAGRLKEIAALEQKHRDADAERLKEIAALEEKQRATESDMLSDRAHFRTLFDGAGVGVALVDRDQKFLETNSELQRMLGFSNEEFKSKTLLDVSHPDDTKMTAKSFQEVLDGKLTHFIQEKCFRNKDLGLVWVRMTCSALCGENGAMECMYVTIEDVTRAHDTQLALTAVRSKLQLAEFQYQESETRFRELMEEAAVGIALLDAEGRLMQSNPPLQRMLGLSAEELAAKTFNDLARPEDNGNDTGFHRECVEGKRERYEVEKRFRCPGEDDFWGRLSVSGVREADGSYKYAVAFLEDINAEKNPDAPRKETFSIRLRSPDEGFLTTDNAGRVVLMNHAAERLLGWKHVEAFGKPLGEVMTIVSETRRHRRKSAIEPEGAHEDDTMSLNEIVIKLPNGNQRTILQSVRPLLDLDANSMGMIMVFRDLEEVAKMEHELIDAGKIEADGIMDWQIANEFENILTNLNILAVPLMGRLYAEDGSCDSDSAIALTEELSKNLSTLTGLSQRSLA